jgi:hypothetical protein
MGHEPIPSPEHRPPPRALLLKRFLLVAATAFLTISIWTADPVFALWVGSQVVGKTQLSIGAVFVVILVLAVLVAVMVVALVKLNATYDALIGRPERERRFTWLRSMRAEGQDEIDFGRGVTILERITVITVWIAVVAFLVWFFAFAGSPLPH